MGGKLTIYHGSQKLIQQPVYGAGNVRNDYGLGFYCTENVDLAKEWACTEENSGYANCYQLDLCGLTILNLSDYRYHILNWLSLLLQNRVFKISNDLAAEGKEYMLDTFLPEYEDKDIIIGYRADDSYFAFANAFLNNTLSLAQWEKAMYLGKLGEQIVLKSKKAFEQITYIGNEPVDAEIYYMKKAEREREARREYGKGKKEKADINELFILDIMREGIKNGDARLF